MQVYISNREIEQIAEGLVEVSCGKPPPKCIDIDRIARFLGITVVYEQIAEDDPDKIGFAANGSQALKVFRNGVRSGCVSQGLYRSGAIPAAAGRTMPVPFCEST